MSDCSSTEMLESKLTAVFAVLHQQLQNNDSYLVSEVT